MSRLHYGELWQSTIGVVRRNRGLLVPLAGAFLFLPSLCMSLLQQQFPYLESGESVAGAFLNVTYIVVAAFGQLVALSIILDGLGLGDRLVGSVLADAGRKLPRQLGVAVLSALATLVGLLLLILPGLYVAGRLALASPVLVSEDSGVLDSLRGSWNMTREHAWRVLGYMLLWMIVVIGILILSGAAAGAMGAVVTLLGLKHLGLIIGEMILSAAIAAAAVYLQAAAAVLYVALGRSMAPARETMS